MADKQKISYIDKVMALHRGAAEIGIINTRKDLYNKVNEIEKNLLAEYQTSGAEKIHLVTEKGGLTYSGIDRFVRKHGIEVTAIVL